LFNISAVHQKVDLQQTFHSPESMGIFQCIFNLRMLTSMFRYRQIEGFRMRPPPLKVHSVGGAILLPFKATK
jgi:hypothetical protein